MGACQRPSAALIGSFPMIRMTVRSIDSSIASELVVNNHYLRRRPPISFAFGLLDRDRVVGVVTFGVPASRHMVISACPDDPSLVLELNRLWCADDLPKNTESWFVSRALSLLPTRLILSYADTSHGHFGYVYRALNFRYAGWTDMDRKGARYDYLVPGRHSRDAFRHGDGVQAKKVRRKPKVKYWIVSGSDRREKRRILQMCCWPSLCWKKLPPPIEHMQLKSDLLDFQA